MPSIAFQPVVQGLYKVESKKTSISLAAGERPLLKDSSFGQTRHREVTGGVKVDVIRQC